MTKIFLTLTLVSFLLSFGLFFNTKAQAQQVYSGDIAVNTASVYPTTSHYISPSKFRIDVNYINIGETPASLPNFKINFLSDIDKVKKVTVSSVSSTEQTYNCGRVKSTTYFKCILDTSSNNPYIIEPRRYFTNLVFVDLYENQANSFSYSTDHTVKLLDSKYFIDTNHQNNTSRVLYHGKFTPQPLKSDYAMRQNQFYPGLSKYANKPGYSLNLKVVDLNDTGWLRANRPSYQLDFGNADAAVVSVSHPYFECEARIREDGRRIFHCKPIPYTVPHYSQGVMYHDHTFPFFQVIFNDGVIASDLDFSNSYAKVKSNFWFTDTNETNNSVGPFVVTAEIPD